MNRIDTKDLKIEITSQTEQGKTNIVIKYQKKQKEKTTEISHTVCLPEEIAKKRIIDRNFTKHIIQYFIQE